MDDREKVVRILELLEKIVDSKYDISNEAFPFMGAGEISVCGGVPARLFRISFSGELAYEVNVESDNGNYMWKKIMEIGKEFEIENFAGAKLKIKIVGDEHVDPEFGTGCVKVTPAHDPNDFAIGERHNLAFINIMNADASINSNVPEKRFSRQIVNIYFRLFA